MTGDQNRTDARAGLRGPPAVFSLQVFSDFDGGRCRCRARSAPATKRKIYKMYKRLSAQRDTGNQTKPGNTNRRRKDGNYFRRGARI